MGTTSHLTKKKDKTSSTWESAKSRTSRKSSATTEQLKTLSNKRISSGRLWEVLKEPNNNNNKKLPLKSWLRTKRRKLVEKSNSVENSRSRNQSMSVIRVTSQSSVMLKLEGKSNKLQISQQSRLKTKKESNNIHISNNNNLLFHCQLQSPKVRNHRSLNNKRSLRLKKSNRLYNKNQHYSNQFKPKKRLKVVSNINNQDNNNNSNNHLSNNLRLRSKSKDQSSKDWRDS